MLPDDFDNFARVLDAAYSLHSKSLTADARSLFFAALAEFSLPDVRKAFSAHIKDPQRGQYPPKPADLIAHLRGNPESDGRPDANEAWAIALRSRDERATVVWTQDCAEAFAICVPVLDKGDEIGARMAFKSAYERIVANGRTTGSPAKWVASLGFDAEMREAALSEAVRSNRLQISDVSHVVPQLAAPDEPYDAEKAAQNLAYIRELLDGIESPLQRIERERAERLEAERRSMEELKQQAQSRVDAYGAQPN